MKEPRLISRRLAAPWKVSNDPGASIVVTLTQELTDMEIVTGSKTPPPLVVDFIEESGEHKIVIRRAADVAAKN